MLIQHLHLPIPWTKEWNQRTKATESGPYDNEHVPSHLTRGHTKQLKLNDEEIIQHENGTIQVEEPDDPAIITARPPRQQLANEIVTKIINYVIEPSQRHAYRDDNRQTEQQHDLYTCALINKQFYVLVNPMLWREPVLLNIEPHSQIQRLLDCLADTQLQQQQSLGRYVKKLRLQNTFCTDTELLLLMTHVRHLETLSIENVTYTYDAPPITNTSLQHLPRYCSSHLTCLKLFNIRLPEATIHALGQQCHQLTELTLHSSAGLLWDNNMLSPALSLCLLDVLSFSYDILMGHLPPKMVTHIITRLQGLTHLIHSYFEPSSSSLIMTLANDNDNATTTITKTRKKVFWPHLKKLHLDRCHAIDDATFICFIKTHPHLQSIHLSHAVLTDESLDAAAVLLCDQLHTLFLIGIKGISSDGVRRLIQHCQGLMLASVQSCDQIVASDFLGPDGHALRLDGNDIVRIHHAQG
ncbi:hypothetical protein BCR42DRAFT_421384 [Absidia repens]|uniref:F-box domain-containing protein n=1 Tax=Absidia repens TaxID=90262 RepID=A0A1X2I8G3_9FUNG|nr:hypothetical protein BCR42DRAFT_421384 [Absidia repens]